MIGGERKRKRCKRERDIRGCEGGKGGMKDRNNGVKDGRTVRETEGRHEGRKDGLGTEGRHKTWTEGRCEGRNDGWNGGMKDGRKDEWMDGRAV